MKQQFEFKVTGIAKVRTRKFAGQHVTPDSRAIKKNGHAWKKRGQPGDGNKVSVIITGLHKNRLERLRGYMKAQTGDEPTYHEAVLFAIDTACDTLEIK